MNKGFTLVELLITITVILVGLVGTFTAVQQGITTIDYARSRLTASLLAQEGVEIVKNIRDTNLLEGRSVSIDWHEGLDPEDYTPGATSKVYEVEYEDIEDLASSFTTLGCDPCIFDDLRFLTQDNNGFYGYSGATVTRYKRMVRMEKIAENHLRLTITVYWRTRNGNRDFVLIQEMFAWWE